MNKLLSNVNDDKAFYLKSGKKVKNLKELLAEAKNISADEFNHHVTEERNDFSNWVKHVLEDKKLSQSIGKIRNKKEVCLIRNSEIAFASRLGISGF